MIEVKDGCSGCGLCVPVCPTGALSVQGARLTVVGECVGCGLCVSSCPVRVLVLVETTGPMSGATGGTGKRARQEKAGQDVTEEVK